MQGMENINMNFLLRVELAKIIESTCPNGMAQRFPRRELLNIITLYILLYLHALSNTTKVILKNKINIISLII